MKLDAEILHPYISARTQLLSGTKANPQANTR